MAGDAVEVEFQLTVDDLVAFNLFTFMGQESDSLGAIASQLRGLAVVSLLLIGSFAVTPDRGKPFVIAFSCVFLFFIFIGFIRIKSTRLTIKKLLSWGENILLFSPRKYFFSRDYIEETSKYSVYKLEWSGIEKVKRADNYAFIYLSTMSALIIPKRAFADEAAFEEFYQKCLQYFNAAREKTAESEAA